jgi:hypothetical protein
MGDQDLPAKAARAPCVLVSCIRAWSAAMSFMLWTISSRLSRVRMWAAIWKTVRERHPGEADATHTEPFNNPVKLLLEFLNFFLILLIAGKAASHASRNMPLLGSFHVSSEPADASASGKDMRNVATNRSRSITSAIRLPMLTWSALCSSRPTVVAHIAARSASFAQSDLLLFISYTWC